MSISTNDSLAYLKYKLRCLINKHTSFVSSLTAADEDLGAISTKINLIELAVSHA